MSDQWLRKVKVTVSGKSGSLVIENLKIDFSGKLSIGSAQNTGSVTIWNLSVANRGKLGEEYDELTLEVGYEGGQSGILLKGEIRDVTHSQEGADVGSEIEIGDGDSAVNKGIASKTFPAGTKPAEIVKYLASRMPKVKLGATVGIDDLPPYKQSVVVFGFAKRELDTIGREHKAYWSIQNGTVEMVKADRFINDVTVLSRATGLIGTPELTDKGVKVKCLINPKIKPNRVIDVRSAFLDQNSGASKEGSDQGGGLFRVATVSFNGSNRAQEFYFDIEGSRIQQGKVVK